MKKLLLTLALGVFVSSTVCARKASETYYGATKGGFAISFGADPVINFVGNMFNGTNDQKFDGFKGLGSDLFNGATISGKYMLEDDLALLSVLVSITNQRRSMSITIFLTLKRRLL